MYDAIMEEELKVVTTRLPVAMYERLKERQRADGRMMEWMFQAAIEEWLERQKRATKRQESAR